MCVWRLQGVEEFYFLLLHQLLFSFVTYSDDCWLGVHTGPGVLLKCVLSCTMHSLPLAQGIYQSVQEIHIYTHCNSLSSMISNSSVAVKHVQKFGVCATYSCTAFPVWLDGCNIWLQHHCAFQGHPMNMCKLLFESSGWTRKSFCSIKGFYIVCKDGFFCFHETKIINQLIGC